MAQNEVDLPSADFKLMAGQLNRRMISLAKMLDLKIHYDGFVDGPCRNKMVGTYTRSKVTCLTCKARMRKTDGRRRKS